MPDNNELVVISLKNVTNLNLQWTIDVLSTTGLSIRKHCNEHKNVKLFIGTDENTLLKLATVHHLRKMCKDGTMRIFDLRFKDQFIKEGSYFDSSEEVFLIWQALDSVQPTDTDISVPDTDIIIKKHHTLIHLLRKCKLLDKCYALHDIDHLSNLKITFRDSIFGLLKFKDLLHGFDDIKSYFGIEVAFYFAFTSFYIKWLIPIAFWGLLLYVVPANPMLIMILVCLPNVCWWSIFVKMWKRKSNELAYRWGCLDFRSLEKPRSQFIGDRVVVNPATGQLEKAFSPWKRAIRQYLISLPLIAVFSLVTLFSTLLENTVSASLNKNNNGIWIMSTATTILKFFYQSASVAWNNEFKRLAESLNNFENYRLNSDYEANLTFKMFLFFGVRFTFGLIYESFYKSNIGAIEKTLFSFFITRIFNKQIESTIMPYIKKRLYKQKISIISSMTSKKNSNPEKQGKELIYFKGTYNEYIDIFEQFGLICMFSFVYPWCAVLALIYNVVKVRMTYFALIHVYRRPIPKIVSGIGSWISAFEFVSVTSMMFNLALIARRPDVRRLLSNINIHDYLLLFFGFEHMCLAFKYVINICVSDMTKEVQQLKSRSEYMYSNI